MTYRPLSETEIIQLRENGCQSGDWQRIRIRDPFDASRIQNVVFSGDVFLGVFRKTYENKAGVKTPSGLYDVKIHNCSVGNECLIHKVNNYLANYDIGESVLIENIDALYVEGKTSFGNGTVVNVLNEKGGRSIRIFDELSAQFAYFQVFYRHRRKLQEQLVAIAEENISRKYAERGRVGNNCSIVSCRNIINVKIGDCADIHGVERLKNGSVNSTEDGPVRIGTAVIADNFIINENSRILDGSIVSNCFIGEGAELAKQFSAEHSLFFSNFIGHHGEAFAIFAAPFTATHHRSTLLISAYLSFMNAGSGSNQSNHAYKLGPIHQGVMGRGSKTASGSYILWPSRIGDFTLLLGRHTSHCDTRYMPYSYLVEGKNALTVLIPGVNLKSVGTIRDADKWRERDHRSGVKRDIINFDLLTPNSVSNIVAGRRILKKIQSENRFGREFCQYKGTDIPVYSIEKGIHYYTLGIKKYLGNIFCNHLRHSTFSNREELNDLLRDYSRCGSGQWVDIAGLVAPKEAVDAVLIRIEEGDIDTIESFYSSLCSVHANYRSYSWNWAIAQMQEFMGKDPWELSTHTLCSLLKEWIDVTLELDTYFIEDASKEFDAKSMVGFGMDEDSASCRDDFFCVRGSIENNDFVHRIKQHKKKKIALYERVQQKLNIMK
jgi:carbonic anhydrase/acetyltransferase-like protein (isoleucine patch superfamily)